MEKQNKEKKRVSDMFAVVFKNAVSHNVWVRNYFQPPAIHSVAAVSSSLSHYLYVCVLLLCLHRSC